MFNFITKKIAEVSEKRSDDPQVISYQTLRRSVGWLGLLLPFALLIGTFLFGRCYQVQPSISHYYYTNMREVFEGTLCAVALFLFSYKGYSRIDSITSHLAGFFCLVVALFPTNFIKDNPCQCDVRAPISYIHHNAIHLTAAALFFLMLATISFFLFTKSDVPAEEQTSQKKKRNFIYRLCAIVMVLSLAVILGGFIFGVGDNSKLTFWFETLALVAFGVSWLTKGEALFGD